jgi:hypothetical protein
MSQSTHTWQFVSNDRGNPPGKLADAELHIHDGPMAGLKFVGFAVWERRAGGRNVTFPARQYSVNGERRSFALLRPIVDTAAQDRVRDEILAAYAENEREKAGPIAAQIFDAREQQAARDEQTRDAFMPAAPVFTQASPARSSQPATPAPVQQQARIVF